MKVSIAITLIITIAVFSFISGYSISTHNKMNTGSTATAVEKSSESSGGYGSPSSEEAGGTSTSSPGYGTPSPGYGQ